MSACDEQDEQGTEHNTTAVVTEARAEGTKQSMIAQADSTAEQSHERKRETDTETAARR